eukprot:CAMPEP_0171228740 /NCGR_PEP_ID=MMETSP0790-20130122/38523_1 /TAXON_ID=2925 /ORGANISM="Alexandrium catenella, Strain OF101" /LENGTH=69 /DNA_ID=CAMNT_0011694903 /DNA_START=136 /DNA_END=345 /DNA_ORIENTATION=+
MAWMPALKSALLLNSHFELPEYDNSSVDGMQGISEESAQHLALVLHVDHRTSDSACASRACQQTRMLSV